MIGGDCGYGMICLRRLDDSLCSRDRCSSGLKSVLAAWAVEGRPVRWVGLASVDHVNDVLEEGNIELVRECDDNECSEQIRINGDVEESPPRGIQTLVSHQQERASKSMTEEGTTNEKLFIIPLGIW